MDLKILLIGALMLVNISMANAQMSGSYTIGSSGDYMTIGEAIDSIDSQGLSGDVILNISAGSYTERLDFNNLNNGDFTVTLEGESQQSTTLVPFNQDGATIEAGILMESTSNVILRNFTYDLSAIGSGSTYGFHMTDVSNISIEEIIFSNTGNRITQTIRISFSQDVTIASNQLENATRHIHFGDVTNLAISNNTFTDATESHISYFGDDGSDHITINGNTMEGGGSGIQIVISNLSLTHPSDITIENNELNEQARWPIRAFGADNIDIAGNRITSSNTSSLAALRAMELTIFSGSKIRNNVINIPVGLGIFLSRSNDVQISNNIVSSGDFALELNDPKNMEVVHNTFHVEGSPDVAVWIYGGSQNLSLWNNIFDGTTQTSGINTAIQLLGGHSNLQMDHNLFDTDFGATIDGLSTATTVNSVTVFEEFSLSEWQSLVDLDQHSGSLDPVFLNDTDFRIGNDVDYRFGAYLSAYVMDIDGETRVDGAVDVGADQFCEAVEATTFVEACVSYGFDGNTLTESGEYSGKFVSSNGCDSVVTLNLTILEPTTGSGTITAEGYHDWNGIIYSESGTYVQTLIDQNGCDSIATLELTIAPLFLEGNFIIGSSTEAEYPNFTKAALELRYATIIGDIEYFVEAGTYNDTLNLSSFNAGDFSVTFSGEDKAATILHPLTGIEAIKTGILIDEAHNVTIRNLTLEMDGISDGKVRFDSNDTKGISITNADNTTLANICFKNIGEDAVFDDNDFYISSALFADSVNDLTVDGCSFSGAGVHIALGDHHDVNILGNSFQTAREVINNTETGTDLSIENNDFSGPFRSCIGLNGIENLAISANSIDGNDPILSGFAVLLDETNRATINGNIIENVEYGIDLNRDTLALITQNIVRSLDGEAFYASRTVDLKVINNFFGDIIYLDRQIDIDFIHNTVVSQKERDEIFYFEENGDATEDVSHRIINNIFVGGGQVEVFMLILNEDDNLDLTLDHNLYYFEDATGSIPFITYEGMDAITDYTTLEDWQNEGVYDQNSQSFDPTFVSDDDFHIIDGSDYRFGTFLSDVDNDIDGDIRSASVGIDVGADQYCVPTTSEEIAVVCESYEWNGTTYTGSGIYETVFTNAAGCDSTATLSLTILGSTFGGQEVAVCKSFDWNGEIYTTSGTYQQTLTNASGCDSTAILDLTILEASLSRDTVGTCGSYDWNGMTYTASGIYEKIFTNVEGCDSTAILQLTILDEIKCSPTSISEKSNGQIVVAYPNPSFDGRVYLEGFPVHSSYRLFDLSGKQIANGTLNGIQHQLQLPSKSGPYLLQVDLGNEQVQLKIIKK